MKDENKFDKENELLYYIRSYCKIIQYSFLESDSLIIKLNYNYHYSMIYNMNTEKLNRIYHGFKIEDVDLSKEFKKYQRKIKLEKLNKIL